jgi:hypothetical protein
MRPEEWHLPNGIWVGPSTMEAIVFPNARTMMEDSYWPPTTYKFGTFLDKDPTEVMMQRDEPELEQQKPCCGGGSARVSGRVENILIRGGIVVAFFYVLSRL